jgi:hypothetical protein
MKNDNQNQRAQLLAKINTLQIAREKNWANGKIGYEAQQKISDDLDNQYDTTMAKVRELGVAA